MSRRRSVAVAVGVSGVLVASSAAFAVANGIFRSPATDRVGTFQSVEQKLEAPAGPTTGPTSVAQLATGGAVSDPTTIVATAPRGHDMAQPASGDPSPSEPGSTEPPQAPNDEGTTPPVVTPTSTDETTTPTTGVTATTVPHRDHEPDDPTDDPTDDDGLHSDD